jgi:hypothetical protein
MRDEIFRVPLSWIAASVLSTGLSGCCDSEETVTVEHEGIAAGYRLGKVLEDHETDEDRCEAACRAFVEQDEKQSVNHVIECSATGDVDPDDPWSDVNARVMVTCTTTQLSTGFCTGRRPLGHHEIAVTTPSVGSWLAMHAHLEGASVLAFEELATWLEKRSAPADLIGRCRAAARDEERHAERIGALAHRAGETVPPVTCDPPPDELFEVALHNAVEGCVREAFAAIVAMHQAERAEPGLRSTFREIAADELRHGELAWDLHRWLMPQLSPTERAIIARAQTHAFAELPTTSASNAAQTPACMGWPSPARVAAMAEHFRALAPSLA